MSPAGTVWVLLPPWVLGRDEPSWLGRCWSSKGVEGGDGVGDAPWGANGGLRCEPGSTPFSPISPSVPLPAPAGAGSAV